ncbi:hypothetical protein D3C87_1881370 [compost metagenome]
MKCGQNNGVVRGFVVLSAQELETIGERAAQPGHDIVSGCDSTLRLIGLRPLQHPFENPIKHERVEPALAQRLPFGQLLHAL